MDEPRPKAKTPEEAAAQAQLNERRAAYYKALIASDGWREFAADVLREQQGRQNIALDPDNSEEIRLRAAIEAKLIGYLLELPAQKIRTLTQSVKRHRS